MIRAVSIIRFNLPESYFQVVYYYCENQKEMPSFTVNHLFVSWAKTQLFTIETFSSFHCFEDVVIFYKLTLHTAWNYSVNPWNRTIFNPVVGRILFITYSTESCSGEIRQCSFIYWWILINRCSKLLSVFSIFLNLIFFAIHQIFECFSGTF